MFAVVCSGFAVVLQWFCKVCNGLFARFAVDCLQGFVCNVCSGLQWFAVDCSGLQWIVCNVCTRFAVVLQCVCLQCLQWLQWLIDIFKSETMRRM